MKLPSPVRCFFFFFGFHGSGTGAVSFSANLGTPRILLDPSIFKNRKREKARTQETWEKRQSERRTDFMFSSLLSSCSLMLTSPPSGFRLAAPGPSRILVVPLRRFGFLRRCAACPLSIDSLSSLKSVSYAHPIQSFALTLCLLSRTPLLYQKPPCSSSDSMCLPRHPANFLSLTQIFVLLSR